MERGASIGFDAQELELLRDRRSPRWAVWRAYLLGAARGRFRLPEADAEDAVQSALLKVSSRLEAIRDPRALLAYMLRALLNEVLQVQRQRKRAGPPVPLEQAGPSGGLALAETVPDPRPSAEELLQHAERRRMVEREIERICARARQPRRDLQIALRVLLDRCKSREVAEEMGLPPQTIYNVTHRVLEALAVPVEELT